MQTVGVHGIEFPASKWTSESATQLDTGGALYKEAYQLLRPKLKDIVTKHENILRAKRAELAD